MGSRDEDDELKKKLVSVGKMLASPPSDVEPLLALLDQTEGLLSKVKQKPTSSMSVALYPTMKAMIMKDLLWHRNMDVRLAVASCFSEITRITAPRAPYDDNMMKEIFRLIVDAFVLLDDMSSHSYPKRVTILETVATTWSCVLMLDLDCDALILEMFHHFLKTIRSNHTKNVFLSMESIMTLILEESGALPSGLVHCLLACVKKDNMDLSPVACALGEKVIGNCREKLKPYFIEQIQSTGLPLSSYREIVVSMSQDDSVSPKKSKLIDRGERLADESIVSERTISDELRQVSGKVGSEVGLQEVCSATAARGEPDKIDSSALGSQKGNNKKNSSSVRSTDVTYESLVKVDKEKNTSAKIKGERKNGGSQLSDSPSVVPSENQNDASRRKNGLLSESKLTKKSGVKGIADYGARSSGGKRPMVNYQNGEEMPKAIDDSVGKLHKHLGRKINEAPHFKVRIDESLVGSKIRVWWPDDRRFYEGVVESFDPISRKHKVIYFDNDVEILLLKDERWEFLEDDWKADVCEAENVPSVDASSDRPRKKIARMKSDSRKNLVNIEKRSESGGTSSGKSRPTIKEPTRPIRASHEEKPRCKQKLGGSNLGSTFDDDFSNTSSNSRDFAARKHKRDLPKIGSRYESGSSENDAPMLIKKRIKHKHGSPRAGPHSTDCTSEAGSVSSGSPLRIISNLKNDMLEACKNPKDTATNRARDAELDAGDTGNKVRTETLKTGGKLDKEARISDSRPSSSTWIENDGDYVQRGTFLKENAEQSTGEKRPKAEKTSVD